MSRYFHYNNIDQLREDIARLGVDIRLEESLEYVKRPVKIGHLTAGNSLGIHPMEGCDGTLDGKPGELTTRRWERFGRGGAKLIWAEAAAVLPEGRANPRQLLINEENANSIESLLKITRKTHRNEFGTDNDLVVGLQLTHSGRYSFEKPLIAFHDPVLDPITFVDKKRKVAVTEDYPIMSDDELERVGDALVKAALVAWKIGFDFVDIKQCHKYLLSELLGAKTRPGQYGGSFENRTRLVKSVVERMKDQVGDKLLIASRINAYDGIPYRSDPSTNLGVPVPYSTPFLWAFGVDENDPLKEDITEPKMLVALLQKLGVKMVNISMGCPYYNPHIGRPFEKPPIGGYESPEHPLIGVDRHFRVDGEIQKAFPDMVVVGTGYSWLQQYLIYAAEANMRDGCVTIAAVGRGALAYPDYAKDALSKGSMDRRKVCLTVSYCSALMKAKNNEMGQFPTGCVPRDEVYVPIYKEAIRKLN